MSSKVKIVAQLPSRSPAEPEYAEKTLKAAHPEGGIPAFATSEWLQKRCGRGAPCFTRGLVAALHCSTGTVKLASSVFHNDPSTQQSARKSLVELGRRNSSEEPNKVVAKHRRTLKNLRQQKASD